MVSANGFGISLITEERLKRQASRLTGYAWKLPANFPMPTGLALNIDRRTLKPGGTPDHYFLCPVSDMPLSEYVALLSKLALIGACAKLQRLKMALCATQKPVNEFRRHASAYNYSR